MQLRQLQLLLPPLPALLSPDGRYPLPLPLPLLLLRLPRNLRARAPPVWSPPNGRPLLLPRTINQSPTAKAPLLPDWVRPDRQLHLQPLSRHHLGQTRRNNRALPAWRAHGGRLPLQRSQLETGKAPVRGD